MRRRIVGAGVFAALLGFAVAGAASGASGVTVNGVGLEGSGSRLLDGCALTIEVPDTTDGPSSVRIVVAGHEPSGSAVVVDQTTEGVEGNWSSGALDMTALIPAAGLERAGNGYHLQITVALDGAEIGTGRFWLACGTVQHKPQPWSVRFAVDWRDPGDVSVDPPLPLDAFVLDASSKQGTGQCRYVGADLVCTYTAGGHDDVGGGETTDRLAAGDDHGVPKGLKVSGNGSYTVGVSGVPGGWAVDASTVGTFAAKQQCADRVAAEGTRTPCLHTVVVRAEPQAVTTTTAAPATTTTTAAPVTTTVAAAGATTTTAFSVAPTTRPTVTAPSELPRTGSHPALVWVGALALAAGLALARSTRAAGATSTRQGGER